MKKKTLYMIGNSHIDPVWFWDWGEGMQEVKATFSSALDRLREFPDVKFTATSAAFFEWIEEVAPEMFEEIRQRVGEGRFELSGGWFIEPDCILPCGEAFVRQGLYAQSYFKEKFGVICRTGSNVDSFGHNPMLPQILKKSGMEEYVFMRPRLDTPVFVWESIDGSRVNAISLPSEYTTWFFEKTKNAVELAQAAADREELSEIPCCFGVGNHGGGPTIENIKSIFRLREEYPDTEMKFSSYREYFDSRNTKEAEKLPVMQAFFDGVNTGCYVMDGRLKKSNRTAEGRLFTADSVLAMESLFLQKNVPSHKKEEMKKLWKTLLFNQFHDTLGGTAIKPARDEAIYQFSGVCAEAKKLWTVAMEHMLQEMDTTGEGFPLLLFNPTGKNYHGDVAVEVNWFCKDGLILKNPDGKEIPYQRVHTRAKARNYNVGGRRGLIFQAHIPALGFAVYRTLVGESALCDDSRESGGAQLSGCVLENTHIRVVFDESGCLVSLFDKETGYEALNGKAFFPVWLDERDTWGHEQEEREFKDSGERLAFESLYLVEEGKFRKVVRACYRLGGSVLKQDYILYHDAKEVEVVNRLYWDREWQMLKLCYPLAGQTDVIYREAAYQTVSSPIEDRTEYSMHRFVDVTEKGKAGLCVANDCKYEFQMDNNTLEFQVARSAIYAQGWNIDWYNPIEGYEYTDIGKQEFTFTLYPHGRALAAGERYRQAEKTAKKLLVLSDNQHEGKRRETFWGGLVLEEENVELGSIKAAEKEGAMIIRLFETEGKAVKGVLLLAGKKMDYEIKPYEILTLKIKIDGTYNVTDLLER